MTLDQVIQSLVAIGTISVAILAIWGDQIKFKFGLTRKLMLELHDEQGEPITFSDGMPSRYYHLRVSNKKRWSQATNVRIVITGMKRPAADGIFVNQPLSGPLQLVWRFNALHPLYSIVVPDEICDLGYLKRDDKFLLTPFVVPTNFNQFIGPNEKVRVEVKALADNAESKPLSIDMSWDGIWSDDTIDMSKHLVIKRSN